MSLLPEVTRAAADTTSLVTIAPATSARNTIVSTANAATTLTLKAKSGQTANLQEWQESGGAVRALMDANGRFYVNPGGLSGLVPASLDCGMAISPRTTGVPALVIRRLNGQTADIVSVQDDSGSSSLLRIDKDGNLLATSAGIDRATLDLATGRFYLNYPNLSNFGPSTLDVALAVAPRGTGTSGIIVRANPSQTADLVKWQNSSAVDQMVVSAAGLLKWAASGNEQTTVGAAGGASALPATPTKFLKILDSAGTTLVVPAYAAS